MEDSSTDRKEEFRENIKNNMKKFKSVAIKCTQNSQKEAEDLLQKAFYKGWKYYDSYTSGTNFESWMTTIIYNVYRNMYNKEKNKKEKKYVYNREYDIHHPNVYQSNPEEIYHMKDDFSEPVTDTWKSIPENMRKVLYKYVFEDKQYKEISKEMDIPIGTVMSRLYRARKKAKSHLKEEYGEETIEEKINIPYFRSSEMQSLSSEKKLNHVSDD